MDSTTMIDLRDAPADVTSFYGIAIYAPDEETRDAEIARLIAQQSPDVKMPCGTVVSVGEIPNEWGERPCPCGNPIHTLWKAEKDTTLDRRRNTPTPAKPEYVEAVIDDVMECYVKGFDLKGRELAELRPFEYWYDPVKGKVMFRLWVKSEE
jgi:hypothetical protein